MTSRHEAEANVKADHGSSRSVATTVLAALALFGRALSVEAGGTDGVPPVEWTGTYSFFSDNKPSYPGTPWVFSKIGAADYPDATMLVAALPLPDDGSTGVDILEQGQALFNLDCAATTLSVGACAKVVFGDETTTLLDFNTSSFTGSGRYAFFTEHRPEEFDAESIGGLAPDSSAVVGDGHTHEHAHADGGEAHAHAHSGDGHDNDDHSHGDDDAAADDHVHGDGDDDTGHTHSDDDHTHGDDDAAHTHSDDDAHMHGDDDAAHTHGSDDDDVNGHHHHDGEEIDTGDHTHTTEVHPYEWSGSYELPVGSHTWKLSKRMGRTTYPDASMLIFVTQLEFDHDEDDHDDAGDDGDEVGHQHTAAEHAEILTAAEVEATAMFSSTSAQNKLNGDVIRPAAVMQRIVFDNDDAVTTLTIRIDEAGYYGIFTEHMPWEFDADTITVNGQQVSAAVAHDFSSEHNGHSHQNEAPSNDDASSAGAMGAQIVAAVAGFVAASFF